VRFQVTSGDNDGDSNCDELEVYGPSSHPADTTQDCQIDMNELTAYITRWKLNNLDVTINQMMDAVGKWKAGNAC
jgi:hypothetical protein